MKRLLPLLTVLGLLFAACGDDDTTDETTEETSSEETTTDDAADESASETDEPGIDAEDADEEDDPAGPYSTEDYAAALAAELGSDGSFPGTPDQVDCVATSFVDALGGADALNDAGLSPEELAEAQTRQDLGLDLDEDEVVEGLVGGFETCDYDLIGMLVDSVGANAPAGFEECVRAEVTNDDIARVFARLIIDPEDEDATTGVISRLEVCEDPSSAG